MKKLAITTVALLTVALAGCSSSSDGDGRDCIEVPASVMEQIAGGANTAPIEPITAGAVKSEAFDDVTIVAMSFKASDGTEAEGAWAVGGSLDDPGMTLAVDAVAASFTDWPNEVNGEKLDVTEDGVTEAKACLAAK